MRSCIFGVLISLSTAHALWAHGVTPEQKINQLHVRVIHVNETVDVLTWLAAAAYATAAVVAATCCAVWAIHSRRPAVVWFLFGLLLPIVAAVCLLVRHIQDRKPVEHGI